LDCIVSFKTISGATCQIDSATNSGSTAEIKPAPLDMAPFKAKYAAPGYFSLPAINNVLPLLYLWEFFGREGKSIFFKSR